MVFGTDHATETTISTRRSFLIKLRHIYTPGRARASMPVAIIQRRIDALRETTANVASRSSCPRSGMPLERLDCLFLVASGAKGMIR